ncbi:MAG: pentapeptide repeat-containing protein [Acidobacteriota bacterium]
MTNLLIEDRLISEATRHSLKPDSGEHVFRFCTFEGLSDLELQLGASISSSFLHCTFSDCDWNDPLFNEALFYETRFERCTFRGASFRGCCFVGCAFEDCRFELNALGGPCTFDDSVRWYGCTQRRSPGLEGLF